MRIAYVIAWNNFVNSGVVTKVRDQVAQWQENGHSVEVFCLCNPAAEGSEKVGWTIVERDVNSTSLLRRYRGNGSAIRRIVSKVRSYHPDVVYHRRTYYHPEWSELFRSYPSVMEINSPISSELRMLARKSPFFRALRIYSRLTNRRLLAAQRGVVSVTHELLDSEGVRGVGGLEQCVIPNSINLSRLATTGSRDGKARGSADGRPRLVFIGGPMRVEDHWHGVDKIIELARATIGILDFDLVGQDDYGVELPANITVHGSLAPEACSGLVADADVGIGTMALHRKALTEACPLKVREYLASGLPVIIAYDDTALREVKAKWLLRIPNVEENTILFRERIIEFSRQMRGVRVPREAVSELVGSQALENRRLAFLEMTCRRPAKGRVQD